MLDRVLYRLLTGSSGGFTFRPGPGLGRTNMSDADLPPNRPIVDAGSLSGQSGDSLAGQSSNGSLSANRDRAFDSPVRSFASSGCDRSAVGLYVHIPFCRSLCAFCPYAKVLYSDELSRAYLGALTVEAKAVAARLGPRRISTIYFGGGTPMMMPDAIRMVVELFRKRLVPGAGIGVELHPNDVDPASLGWLREAMLGTGREARVPTTMVSLGVESLHEHTLNYLGRGYGLGKANQTVKAAMDAGFDTVNVDVMTCIPGQSAAEAAADMRRLLRMGVGQVSAYPLMDFSFTRGRTSHSLWSQRRTLTALARAGAAEGYERSSVWTWTRPDVPKYTSITRERFIGIGASAATYLDGYFGVNTFDVRAYVEAVSKGRPPVALHSILSPQESALYWLFWRCYEGRINLDSLEAGRVRGLRGWANLARMLGLGTWTDQETSRELAGGQCHGAESASRGSVREQVAPGASVGVRRVRRESVSERSVRAGPVRRKALCGIFEAGKSVSGRVFHLTDNGLFLYHILERHYTRAYIGRLWAACREAAFPQGIML